MLRRFTPPAMAVHVFDFRKAFILRKVNVPATETTLHTPHTSSIITVAELFAGVGGFRLGLEGYKGKSATSGYKKKLQSPFKTIFSNQWEPNKNKQMASAIYQSRFGSDGHVCQDVAAINADDIPDHDMLVGGFPCQDFSIANRVNAGGLNGKKAYCGGRYTA